MTNLQARAETKGNLQNINGRRRPLGKGKRNGVTPVLLGGWKSCNHFGGPWNVTKKKND